MIYWPPGRALDFRVLFVCNGLGAPGLTVTVDVYDPAGARIVTAAAAADLGGGVYAYTADGIEAGPWGPYVAHFKTAAGHVHQRLLCDRIAVGPTDSQALTVERTGLTIQELYRLLLAAVAGPGAGADSSLVRLFDPTRQRQRIVAELDARRNRAQVLLDAGEVLVETGNVVWERLTALDTVYAALDGSAVAGDEDGVVYWPGQSGRAAAIQTDPAARLLLDTAAIGGLRGLRHAGGSYMTLDQIAELMSGTAEWAFAVTVSLPAVGPVPGQQMLLSTGNSGSGTAYSEWSVPANSLPRWQLLRSGPGGSISINGQYAQPGLHTYAAILQGGAVNLGMDGAWNGPASLGAAVESPVNRVTLGARRRNGAASIFTPAGAQVASLRLWQGAVTPEEVTAELVAELAETEHYDVPLVVGQQVVGAAAHHNAFPALYRLDDLWLLCYRGSPSSDHAAAGAILHILASDDFVTWDEVATLAPADLSTQSFQEGRFLPGPGGKVYLYTVLRYPVGSSPLVVPVVYSSTNGLDWDEETTNAPDGFWFWRPALMGDGTYLCAAYNLAPGTPRQRLYSSSDGLTWDVLVPTLTDRAGATEAALAWVDGRCYYLSRIDGSQTHLWGYADAPYTSWTIEEHDLRMQSPALIPFRDGLLVGARAIANQTVIDQVAIPSGALARVTSLPSGAATAPESGYPDLVEGDDGWVHVAWYGNHLGYTAVEAARLRVPEGGS